MTDVNNPSEQFLRSIDVHSLLLQQDPYILTGPLVHYEKDCVKSEFTVPHDGFFVRHDKLRSAGMVENIAQTCALRLGYVNKYILGKGIEIGVIAAVRNMRVFDHPSVGDTITTTIKILKDVMGMMLAEATIDNKGRVLATATVKMAVKNRE